MCNLWWNKIYNKRKTKKNIKNFKKSVDHIKKRWYSNKCPRDTDEKEL